MKAFEFDNCTVIGIKSRVLAEQVAEKSAALSAKKLAAESVVVRRSAVDNVVTALYHNKAGSVLYYGDTVRWKRLRLSDFCNGVYQQHSPCTARYADVETLSIVRGMLVKNSTTLSTEEISDYLRTLATHDQDAVDQAEVATVTFDRCGVLTVSLDVGLVMIYRPDIRTWYVGHRTVRTDAQFNQLHTLSTRV